MSEAPASIDELLQSGFRYALSLVHDRATAEELLQEACARIARAGGPWRLQYMIPVIRNSFRDQLRRRGRAQTVRLDEADAPACIEDHTSGFDDAMERALGTLRPEERELLFLSVVEGYSVDEIAELSVKPRGTVLSMVHRAKEKLRRVLSVREGRVVP